MKVMNHNPVNQLMQRYWATANASNVRAIRNLASGYRINSVADDAAGLSAARRMHVHSAGLDSASRNAQDAVSMLQTADGVLYSAQDVVARMGELAERASNGVLSDPGRGMLQNEYQKLTSELDKIGQTSFNGCLLFDGSSYTVQMGIGPEDTAELTMDVISAASLGLDRVELSSTQDADWALDTIWDAAQSLSSQRAAIGASENGLLSLIGSLGSSDLHLGESLSKIADADMAEESMNRDISAALGLTAMSMMKNASYLVPYNTLQLLMR